MSGFWMFVISMAILAAAVGTRLGGAGSGAGDTWLVLLLAVALLFVVLMDDGGGEL